MKKSEAFWASLLVFALLLSSCKIPAPLTPEPTKIDPYALFTAAAQTAEAKQALLGLGTPALPPESMVATAAATTPTPAPTVLPPSPTGPIVATVVITATSGPASEDDKAEFVSDVTVLDGTTFKPNEKFTKTWRLKNVGVSTWTTTYALVFISDSLMSGAPVVQIPKDVPPGETVDISVDMIAPLEPGIYKSFWMLRNANGQVFGAGLTASDPFWAIIAVAEASGATPAGTIVTALSLKVDNSQFTGACPHSFNFTATFTLSQAATVTFNLEAGGGVGIEIKLPPPASRNLEAGTHTIVYELIFASSIGGWARLHIGGPENLYSNQVDFNLTCQ